MRVRRENVVRLVIELTAEEAATVMKDFKDDVPSQPGKVLYASLANVVTDATKEAERGRC